MEQDDTELVHAVEPARTPISESDTEERGYDAHADMRGRWFRRLRRDPQVDRQTRRPRLELKTAIRTNQLEAQCEDEGANTLKFRDAVQDLRRVELHSKRIYQDKDLLLDDGEAAGPVEGGGEQAG